MLTFLNYYHLFLQDIFGFAGRWLLVLTLVLAVTLAYLVTREIARAAVVSMSILVFTWACARRRGMKVFPAALKWPWYALTGWLGYLGYEPGTLTVHDSHGIWNGVGQWSLYSEPYVHQLRKPQTIPNARYRRTKCPR